MLWVSRFQSHKTGVSSISQEHWEKQGTCCYFEQYQPEDDSDNEDDRILNAFTATVNPIEGIVENVDEKEELVDYKIEKMDDQK